MLGQATLLLCRGSSAGRVEGGAVGARGRVLGGPFAWGGVDVKRMPLVRPWVVLWWLEAGEGREGVYGDGGALMRGVEAVVVAACVVGDDDVRCLYVVVKRGVGGLFGDARCPVSCFGCGVVQHDDVDSPFIVGRQVELR